jgi:hypothetical protein
MISGINFWSLEGTFGKRQRAKSGKSILPIDSEIELPEVELERDVRCATKR